MRPNTPMEAALRRWCKENDLMPGTLVRLAFQGGALAMRKMCAEVASRWQEPEALKLAAGEMTAQELRTAIAVLGAVERGIRALTTDQGEKEQADGS